MMGADTAHAAKPKVPRMPALSVFALAVARSALVAAPLGCIAVAAATVGHTDSETAA